MEEREPSPRGTVQAGREGGATGSTCEKSADSRFTASAGGFLDEPSLPNLFAAKALFEETRDGKLMDRRLSPREFVDEIHAITGEDKDKLSQLFMKIDCNSDGSVTWDEVLSYVLQQQNFRFEPLRDQIEATRYTRLDQKPPPITGVHSQPAYSLTYVPRCSAYVSTSHDGTMRIWNVSTLRLEGTRRLSDRQEVAVNAVNQLPQSFAKLAVATADRMVSFYELSDLPTPGRWGIYGRMCMCDIPIALASFALVRDTLPCFAVGDVAGKVHIYDTNRLVERFWKELDRAQQIKRDSEPRALTQETLELCKLATLSPHSDWVTQIHFVAPFKTLITASLDASIQMTSVQIPASFEPTRVARLGESRNASAKSAVVLRREFFSATQRLVTPNHKGVHHFIHGVTHGRHQLASCGLGRQVFVWSLDSADLLKSLEGHNANVSQLAYDRKSDLLISLDTSGEMRTWDFATLARVHIMALRPDALEKPTAILYDAAHQVLVTADKRPVIWMQPQNFEVASKSECAAASPLGHQYPIVGVLYSPNFCVVVSADVNGLICVWDAISGAQRFRFEHQGNARLTSLRFDRSGRRLITGCSDGSVRLWNFSSGELLNVLSYAPSSGLPPPRAEVTALLHIEHGANPCYASAGWSGELWLWPDPSFGVGEMEDGHVMSGGERLLRGHAADILSVAYCESTPVLATGAFDGEIRIWSVISGSVKATLRAPDEGVQPRARGTEGLASPQGSNGGVGSGNLLSAAADESIECLAFLDPKAHALADAPTLVSCGADGCLRVWNVRPFGEGTGHAFAVRGCCAPSESLTALAVAENNEHIVTGDSAGRLIVWVVSALVAAIGRRGIRSAHAGDETLVVKHASWRAHSHVVVGVELIHQRGALVSASTDGSVVLWTLRGVRIGFFGQVDVWNINQPPRAILEFELERSRATEVDESNIVLPSQREDTASMPVSQSPLPRTAPSRATRDLHSGANAWPVGAVRSAHTMSATELRTVLRNAQAKRVGELSRAKAAEAAAAAAAHRLGRLHEPVDRDLLARLSQLPAGSLGTAKALSAQDRAAVLLTASLPPLEMDSSMSPRGRRRNLSRKAFAPRGWDPQISRVSRKSGALSAGAGPRTSGGLGAMANHSRGDLLLLRTVTGDGYTGGQDDLLNYAPFARTHAAHTVRGDSGPAECRSLKASASLPDLRPQGGGHRNSFAVSATGMGVKLLPSPRGKGRLGSLA